MTESVCVLLWISTDHCDEGKGVEHQDEKDLAAGQPKFSLAVCLDSENVAGTVGN